MPLLKKVILK